MGFSIKTKSLSHVTITILLLPALAFAQGEPDLQRTEGPPPETGHPYGGGLVEREYLLGDPLGVRSALAANGIDIEAGITADASEVFEGGADEGASAFRHLFEVGLTIDPERLTGLKGGEFFVSFVNQNGRDASESTGDFQVFSNIDEADFTAIYEMYYQQVLFGERLRIKVGKVDANEEFAYVENGGEFIHSSPGFSPTILSFPSYPDPATSVNVFAYPRGGTYAGFGLYDGALQEGVPTGRRGPSTFFGDPADLFLIGEAGLAYGEDRLPGRIGVGVWRHTGTFDRFDGEREDGTTGFYLVFDQTFYRKNPGDPDDPRGAGLFAQYGWADPELSEAEHHLGLGTQWTGPLPGRTADVAGLMGSYAHFSDEPGAGFTDSGEFAVEAFYRIQGTPWFALKPDLQYIANPGGTGLSDAWVGTLRAEIAF